LRTAGVAFDAGSHAEQRPGLHSLRGTAERIAGGTAAGGYFAIARLKAQLPGTR